MNVPSINNIWVIVRKQNFNQNFNLNVDAATRPPSAPPPKRKSISQYFSLKKPAQIYLFSWTLKLFMYLYTIIITGNVKVLNNKLC